MRADRRGGAGRADGAADDPSAGAMLGRATGRCDGSEDMRTLLAGRRAPVWLEAQAPLAEWYGTALGQSILDELEGVLAGRLRDVFGYQGLQVGNPAPERDLLAGAGLHRRLRLDAVGRDHPSTDVQADVTALPVATGTMKAVLFFHTLDFCAHPHQALREADRVLTDDGQLLIVGFSPFGLFGLRRAATFGARREPWNGHFWSRGRVAEWLSVLDYRVLGAEPLFVRPPVNAERMLRRLAGLERLRPWAAGGLYVIRARKQTVPMTLIRRPWLRARAGAAVGARGLASAGVARAAGPRAGVVELAAVRDAYRRP